MRARGRAALLAGAVLLGGAALVVRVPEGSTGVVVWRGGGTPGLLASGMTFRVPFLQRVFTYPGGRIEVAGTAQVSSKEGTALALPFKAAAHPGDQVLLALHQPGGTAAGAREALRSAAEEEIGKSAASLGTYDLASGLALQEAAAAARAGLEKRFGSEVKIDLGKPDLPPDLKAAFDLRTIYARRQETGVRVLLIGLDSADWDVLDPLIARGEVPNLARLKSSGAWARLRSNVPTLSPILWTTVATGKAPDKHGVNDFLVADPRTGRKVPINSTFRRTKALWNILSDAGVTSDFIAWWASWPAEAVRGHLVSDRVSYSTFSFAASQDSRGAVYPPEYAATVERLRVSEASINYRQVARFLHVSEGEFHRARVVAGRKGPVSETLESINVFTRVLAATETYRRVALDLLDAGARSAAPARLSAVYFEGIDEVNHRFAHCAPPREPLCPAGDYDRFKDAVTAFYRYQDEIVGELQAKAPGSTVLILSDHGFSSGANRPRTAKPFIEGGDPGRWHDLYGIFIAGGPSTRNGEMPVVTLYDIAPTILHLLGLPVPDDMPGRVLEAALSPDFMARHPIVRAPSYEGLPEAGEQRQADAQGVAAPGQGEILPDAADDEVVNKLRSLGYVNGGNRGGAAASASGEAGSAPAGARAPAGPDAGSESGGIPTLLFHTNLARVYLQKKQYDLAEAEYRQALRIQPGSAQALGGLAVLYEAKGEPEKALETVRNMVRQAPAGDPGPLVKVAELFIQLNRAEDGVAFLTRLQLPKGGGPKSEVARWVALGMLHTAAGNAREAESSLLKALGLEPTSVNAMQELFALYDAQGRAQDLEPRLRAALSRDPRSAMHHNWLGLIAKRRGDLKGAEAEFQKALALAPDLVGVMANLGSLLLQQERAGEAVELLTRALEKEPRNVESRTNLIVALGMTHDLAGAAGRVAEAKSMGQRVPHFYNALAYALYINGQQDKAMAALKESLKIDPRQPDALRLRAEIEQGQPVAASPYR